MLDTLVIKFFNFEIHHFLELIWFSGGLDVPQAGLSKILYFCLIINRHISVLEVNTGKRQVPRRTVV